MARATVLKGGRIGEIGRFPWQEAARHIDCGWDGRESAATRWYDATHCRDAGGHKGRRMNANLRNFALWVIIILLLLALFTLFNNPGQRTTAQDISFSQLLTEVDQGRVRDVVIQGPDIHGTFANGTSFQTYAPNDPGLVQKLYSKGVTITARPPSDNVPWFVSLLVSWLPFIALIGVWIFLSRQMQ